jgi:hypothetical protein
MQALNRREGFAISIIDTSAVVMTRRSRDWNALFASANELAHRWPNLAAAELAMRGEERSGDYGWQIHETRLSSLDYFWEIEACVRLIGGLTATEKRQGMGRAILLLMR